jgi:RimJ/RimL family protein N-acetyltransferase
MSGLVCRQWPKTLRSGIILGMYVRVDWRGYHLGEALLKACFDWAHDHGLTIVKLAVITTNTSAIRCDNPCGFTVYGVEPKALSYNGVEYDSWVMSRLTKPKDVPGNRKL